MISPTEMKGKWHVKWIYYFLPDISEKSILLVLGVTIIVIYLLKNAFKVLNVYVQMIFTANFDYESLNGQEDYENDFDAATLLFDREFGGVRYGISPAHS